MNRLISACISTCIVFSVFVAANVAAKPIELVGPNNKVAGKNKTATYGPVKTTDTLWRIAFNHRPDPKLTVDQVLIAIFMANPQAFKNNDIHSIISGSTLTIPSQSDIESITDAAAKLRIANNDQLKTNNRPVARTVSPTTESKPPATTNTQTQTQKSKPTVVVPERVEKKPEFVDEKGPEQSDTNDQSANVTPVQQENPGLSEQLALAMTDMQLLIKENQALKEQIKALDDKLAEMQTQEALDLQAHEELAELKDELAEIQLAKDMEHDSLLNNGWVIGTIFSLLSTGIMAGVFFWLVRRHKPAPEEPTEAKTAADDNAVPDLETEDDLLEVDADDDLLISDEDDDLLEISDIDDLPDLDDDLLSDGDEDDELLVPSDLDEIQLDDSSELSEPEQEIAQEEAPKEDEGILAQDDLEALLAQADELEEEEAQGDPDLSDDIVSTDDIDALLAQADELEVDDADELTSDDDIDALLDEANDAVSDDDIDALLDEANDAVAADDIDALLDEANAPVDADDIDALLDEANAPVDVDDIDALLDEANAPVEADDIDALLDEANAPVEADDIDALLDEANAPVEADDIDALLDEANAPVEADDIDALLDEANAPVEADDIDALLDEANAPVEADDIDALLDEANAPVEADDIDALLDEANAPVEAHDIDALLAETDELVEEDAVEAAADVAVDDIDALLAETDELVEEDVVEPAADVAVDDIDALLSETDELIEEEVVEAAADVAVDDIDALLAETDELVEEDAVEPAADVAVDDIDALLAETDELVEEDVVEPAADVAVDDIDALLSETDELIEEEVVEAAADVAVDDIDALLSETESLAETETLAETGEFASKETADTSAESTDTVSDVEDIDSLLEGASQPDLELPEDDIEPLALDIEEEVVAPEGLDDLLSETDSLLAPEQDERPISTLEQLSQLDTVDEPYLMTEDATDEDFFSEQSAQVTDAVESNSGLSDVEQQNLAQALESLDDFIDPTASSEPTPELAIEQPQELAPSQEAQHLVDALDSMLDTSAEPQTAQAAVELDEFINTDAIVLDDADLTQSMAEFDEEAVIEPSTQESIASPVNSTLADSVAQLDDINDPVVDLLDAEAQLSEQLPKFEQENSFIDIDKLLDESAMNEQETEPYQNVDLDIGLDEFPEMLPETGGIDVDDDPNGASKKLDLARAYLEIDDEDSARDMLEQVKQSGDESQIKEVEKLMKRLKH